MNLIRGGALTSNPEASNFVCIEFAFRLNSRVSFRTLIRFMPIIVNSANEIVCRKMLQRIIHNNEKKRNQVLILTPQVLHLSFT